MPCHSAQPSQSFYKKILSRYGAKINRPIIIERITDNRTAPAMISLIALIVEFLFLVTKSNVFSRAVLINSKIITKNIIIMIIIKSYFSNFSKNEARITKRAIKKCILKFFSLLTAKVRPSKAYLKLSMIFFMRRRQDSNLQGLDARQFSKLVPCHSAHPSKLYFHSP